MNEAEFIAALRRLPLHGGAGGLLDDAARLGNLILTSDTLVESIHYLPSDPAEDVAWKLAAVNLSDLAAKGATPVAAMLSYPLGDDDWDRAFLAGLAEVLGLHRCPLLGGDTVSLPPGAPRVLTLTAIGRGVGALPSRSGAQAGDTLWVTGCIGDAGPGLTIAQGMAGPAQLLAAYRRPVPRLADGRMLAKAVQAMMDISDGLLIDAGRMAQASGLAISVDLAAIPLSNAYRAFVGDDRPARLAAATAGDDYQLLFALAPGAEPPVAATCIGSFAHGGGLTLHDGGEPIDLPDRLGWLHNP